MNWPHKRQHIPQSDDGVPTMHLIQGFVVMTIMIFLLASSKGVDASET